MKNRAKIIAVDFDGTLVENKWPEIGATNMEVLDYCKKEREKGARIILWTNRVDERLADAVKWCEENGLHLDAVNDNLKEMVDFFGGNTRKIFADEFIDDRAAQGFNLPYPGEPSWADREIALACGKEREMSEIPGEEVYGIACYKSALRAFRSLMHDGHTEFSLGITKGILNRLISGKCLTPIEDIPEIWAEVHIKEDGIKRYQCKRMGSLFKEVTPDGAVTYSDVNRVQVVNIDEPEIPYQNGFVTRLIDKLYPIAMPYFPSEKKFKVVRDEFLTDQENKDFDTVGYLYVITPNGEKVELNGYFKCENIKDGMVRIDKAEYDERKAKRVKKNG